jgi:hypothetical protein
MAMFGGLGRELVVRPDDSATLDLTVLEYRP